MKAFVSEGQFWLPEAPDRLVPGTLALSDVLTLALDGSLLAYAPAPDGRGRRSGITTRHQVVHGRLRDGRESTLLDVRGTDASSPYGEVAERHSVRAALVPGLIKKDLFVQASCRFDGLHAWVDPDPMSEECGGPDDRLIVSTARRVLAEAKHDELTIRIVVVVEGESGGERVRLDQVCQIEVQGPPSPLAIVVDRWVRPVQDLLVVALGGPARLASLRIGVPDADPYTGRPEVFFVATQPPEGPVPPVAGMRSYYSPALHRREDTEPPLHELLPAWFGLRDRVGDGVSLITAPFHAPFMYAQHKYATSFQAAEALMRRLHSGPDKPRREHRERVRTVSSALAQSGLPKETVGWATRILQARNDKPLPRMIDELLESVGDVGATILAVAPDFGRTASDLRTGVSHGGTDKADSARRHWHGQALLWAVRIRLLHEVGVPLALLTGRASGTPAFQQMLAELGEPGRRPGS